MYVYTIARSGEQLAATSTVVLGVGFMCRVTCEVTLCVRVYVGNGCARTPGKARPWSVAGVNADNAAACTTGKPPPPRAKTNPRLPPNSLTPRTVYFESRPFQYFFVFATLVVTYPDRAYSFLKRSIGDVRDYLSCWNGTRHRTPVLLGGW